MESQFDSGLGRNRKDCRICEPNTNFGKIVCSNHRNFEDICSTYLLDYALYKGGRTKNLIIRKLMYTAVLCPVSEDCKQVRLLNFVLVEWCPTWLNGTQFLIHFSKRP